MVKHRNVDIQVFFQEETDEWIATAKHPKEKGVFLKSYEHSTLKEAFSSMCSFLDAILDECPSCEGTGKIYRYLTDPNPRKCNYCNGAGTIKTSLNLS